MVKCEYCGEGKCKCDIVRARMCPRCKSLDVGFTFGIKNLFGIIPQVRCRKCGYSATEFPLLVVNKTNLKDIVKKKKVVKKKSVKKVKKTKSVRKKK